MKAKKILLLFLITLGLTLAGQKNSQRQADSLEKIIPSLNGEQKVDALNHLAYFYLDKLENSEKALPLSNEAFKLAENLNYKKGKAEAYLNRGRILQDEGKYEKAVEMFGNGIIALNSAKKNIFNKYEQIILPVNDPVMGKIIADLYSGLGACYREEFNLSKSAQYYIQALMVYETVLDTLSSSFIVNMQKHGEIISRKNFTIKAVQDYLKKHPEDKESDELKNMGSDINGGIRWTCLALGNLFEKTRDYSQALNYLKKAEKNAEEVQAVESHLRILGSIGTVYSKRKQYDSAVVYYKKLCRRAEEVSSFPALIEGYSMLGGAYREKGDYNNALGSFEKVNEYLKPLSDGSYETIPMYRGFPKKAVEGMVFQFRTAINTLLIGDIYRKKGDQPEAIKKYNDALALQLMVLERKKQLKDTFSLVNVNHSIGNLYQRLGNGNKAVQYFEALLPFYEKVLPGEEQVNLLNDIRFAYEKKGDPNNAYKFYKKYITLKDSLFGNKNANELAEIQKRFEVEKKDADIELLSKSQEAYSAEVEKQKLVRNVFIAGSFALVLLAFFIFRSLQQNKKAKKIIEHQKELVEEKNKEITDSITYAKRLQEAILPQPAFVKENLPGSFILYKPKDIVAGDFYWAEKTGDTFYIAAADCTGHGVPGAMVSVVCSNALNRTVKEFRIAEPGKILDKVRELVIETFEKSDKEVKDGMDISLCAINTKTGTVQWAGANNPLWYIENNELKEITADKQPIGKFDHYKPFATHSLTLPVNSSLYLFTDGYADQFGGPKGKKFKYKQLSDIILQVAGKSPAEIKNILDNRFEDWRAGTEQVDDVCIIGIHL